MGRREGGLKVFERVSDMLGYREEENLGGCVLRSGGYKLC